MEAIGEDRKRQARLRVHVEEGPREAGVAAAPRGVFFPELEAQAPGPAMIAHGLICNAGRQPGRAEQSSAFEVEPSEPAEIVRIRKQPGVACRPAEVVVT